MLFKEGLQVKYEYPLPIATVFKYRHPKKPWMVKEAIINHL